MKTVRLLTGKLFKKCSEVLMGDIYAYDVFRQSCLKKGYHFSATESEVKLVSPDNVSFFLRKGTSDVDVCRQVLLAEEYKPVVDCLKNNNIPVSTVVDCGGNIGLSSLYFKQAFPDAAVYVLEADEANYRQAVKNISQQSKTKIFNKAVWYENTTLSLDHSFRDHKEWSVRVKLSNPVNEKNEKSVKAVTIDDFIKEQGVQQIDLLKVDIEGAEKEIFTDKDRCRFLAKTKVIAIEIHDEFNIRKEVTAVLKHYNFLVVESGETTIGVNLSFTGNNFL